MQFFAKNPTDSTDRHRSGVVAAGWLADLIAAIDEAGL